MNPEGVDKLRHTHAFGTDKRHAERLTLAVVIITLTMMALEIAYGLLANSMALLADGMHMGTHACALAVSYGAYWLARKHASNSLFTFGAWKIEILGAFSSALLLGVVALSMIYVSLERLMNPVNIHYDQALIVAGVGLAINLISALILSRGGSHHHHHAHEEHHHPAGGKDLNLRSAYIHVITDALTSVFAIGALLGAKYLSWDWLDPFMGIVGAILIIRWGWILLRDSSHILLDYKADQDLANDIRKVVETGGTAVCDLHLWRIGDDAYACIISLVSDNNLTTADYKEKLAEFHHLAHITVEINQTCPTKK